MDALITTPRTVCHFTDTRRGQSWASLGKLHRQVFEVEENSSHVSEDVAEEAAGRGEV